MRSLGWTLIQYMDYKKGCPYKKGKCGHAQREDDVKTHREKLAE